jgi:hypothetical protein
MSSSGMLYRVTLVRTDVSEERTASIIRVAIIGELGTTLTDAFQQWHKSWDRLLRSQGDTSKVNGAE